MLQNCFRGLGKEISKREPVKPSGNFFAFEIITRTFEDLPKNARDYIGFIEDLADVPVSIIAVGPSREQTIFRRWDRRP